MIPVRVSADAKPVLASERRFRIGFEHPMGYAPCPACGKPLAGQSTVLVLTGIAPEADKWPAEDRAGRWATGGAVLVHAACAGVPDTA